MNSTDLARARRAALAKRPAEVIRAAPLTLTAVRALPQPVTPGRVVRFREWRRDHYVADQVLRVLVILAAGAVLLALAGVVLLSALGSLIDGATGPALLGLLAFGLVVSGLVVAAGRRSGSAKHRSGYGFHWTKCK